MSALTQGRYVPMAADDEGRRWRRFIAGLPMRTSLVAVAVVWLLGCVWSFQEQSAFAASKGFTFPHLLPLVIDGFAVSMAGVSWAASLDARPALPARVATLIAVTASSASNGAWAYLRTAHDLVAVALGMAVPIAANLAFEVLLAELRRQVQRRRGLPAPIAIPYPRVIRFVLAPVPTFRAWRQIVLQMTAFTDPIAVSTNTATVVSKSATSEQLAEPQPSGDVTREQLPPPDLGPVPAGSPGIPVPPDQSWTSVDTHPHPARPAESDHKPLLNLAPTPAPVSVTTRPPASSGDPRAVALAQRLAAMAAPDNVTGRDVGLLLALDIAPRTGRRLLGQARHLLKDHQPDPGELVPQPCLSASR